MKYGILIIVSIQVVSLKAQLNTPEVTTDLNAFYQLFVRSVSQDQGAKLHLGELSDDIFLRLYSSNEKSGIEDPMISRSQERALIFASEDYEALSQEQMRLSADGKLIVKDLAGATTRNLVVMDDGTLKAQSVGIYAGVKTLTAYDFVSESNPAEDHNVNLPGREVYHESIIQGMESLVAPVDLPHLCRIKKIEVRYRDQNINDSIRVELEIAENAGPNSGTILIGHSQLTSGSYGTMTANLDIEVNNIQHTYFIRALNPNDVTDWPGSDVGIWTTTIYYDLQ